jgi:hypothetical protein
MCQFEILSVFLKTQIKLGQVSGSYLNPPLLGMTLNKNVLKNIGGEITDGILLNGDAQKIKVITGGEITCPPVKLPTQHLDDVSVPSIPFTVEQILQTSVDDDFSETRNKKRF